jgi:hypothetical protein
MRSDIERNSFVILVVYKTGCGGLVFAFLPRIDAIEMAIVSWPVGVRACMRTKLGKGEVCEKVCLALPKLY